VVEVNRGPGLAPLPDFVGTPGRPPDRHDVTWHRPQKEAGCHGGRCRCGREAGEAGVGEVREACSTCVCDTRRTIKHGPKVPIVPSTAAPEVFAVAPWCPAVPVRSGAVQPLFRDAPVPRSVTGGAMVRAGGSRGIMLIAVPVLAHPLLESFAVDDKSGFDDAGAIGQGLRQGQGLPLAGSACASRADRSAEGAGGRRQCSPARPGTAVRRRGVVCQPVVLRTRRRTGRAVRLTAARRPQPVLFGRRCRPWGDFHGHPPTLPSAVARPFTAPFTPEVAASRSAPRRGRSIPPWR
jgi:hypothetical protein